MESVAVKISRITKANKWSGFLVRLMPAFFIFLFLTHAAWAGPQYGGSLRIVGEVDAMGFDAIKARFALGAGSAVGNLVMEKLFNRGRNGELIPALGFSADSSEDGKAWTVTLREGVKFHDGTPFNADAVVLHWRRLLDPKNRYSQRILFQPITSVEKTGEYEVRFHLKHAWMPFMAVLTDPSGFTSLIPSPKAVKDGTQNRAPVGTGPFIFKEWKNGQRIVLVKNPDYRQKGKPYLDEIIYRAIPDHESRYAALVSGQADLMITDRPTHVNKLKGHADFSTYVFHPRGATILVLNNTRPPLDDVRVRRAMAMAWEQKKYIALSCKNIMPYTEHWFGDALDCGDAGYWKPDLKKAANLIAEYGKPVELEYIHSATPRGREAGVILQQMMKEIGVTIKPVPSDLPGIMKKLFSKKFDVTSWLILGAYDMGPVTMAILHSKSPWNVTGYFDEEVDKLLDEQNQSTDPEFKAETLCAIARKVNSEAPFLYLYGRNVYFIAKNNIKNLTLPVLGEEGLQMADIWMEQ